ncbi:hypothetical protein AMJ74_03975 [candidate division WOR_3 bacterium SM1_77]|jgi:16S rRNA (adenine1518-N6/adenine1519-N6)-dimethyltransferase|uniref:Ribosomal RNA small subunit methyltransferase A n=1 Tax=candidate division WOR_3 bacterium SM1_77 TaxID=1703778 RepID=A0A0S8JY51_UNCW3|nr:MAG: hypothetical protein AMJ74_03975 [candidate division WOR_3 bacterium SM1_77]
MRTKRRILGQHFLNSPRLAERVARIAKIENQVVVEIGSGKGILTRQLAKRAKKVIAVEIDSWLANYLQELGLPRVHVLNRDFLKIDLCDWGNTVVVGNIPYNITSVILRKLAENKEYVERVVFTVQKEYAVRMMAPVGSSKYGYVSIYTNHHFDVRKEFNIQARYFSPRPKVNSVVITLIPRKTGYDVAYEAKLFEFIAGVFRYRRKSLKNAIMNYGQWLPMDLDDDRFGQRPQHLSLDDYREIYRMISRAS